MPGRSAIARGRVTPPTPSIAPLNAVVAECRRSDCQVWRRLPSSAGIAPLNALRVGTDLSGWRGSYASSGGISPLKALVSRSQLLSGSARGLPSSGRYLPGQPVVRRGTAATTRLVVGEDALRHSAEGSVAQPVVALIPVRHHQRCIVEGKSSDFPKSVSTELGGRRHPSWDGTRSLVGACGRRTARHEPQALLIAAVRANRRTKLNSVRRIFVVRCTGSFSFPRCICLTP